MSIHYKIVQKVAGKFVTTRPTDIRAWAEVNDRKCAELSERRRSVLREELQYQPKIEGLLGPMYDGLEEGNPVVRYEDDETFREMST